jgi:putative MATE family efflux protein
LNQEQKEKYIRMTTEPVKRLILSLAWPAILSMIVTAVYNMADTFFVGRLGTSATGGVGVIFPVMTLIQAIGFSFGQGTGNYMSRLLGQRRGEEAERVAATGFFTVIGLGVLLSIPAELFLTPLVHLLGATQTIEPFAADYLRFILLGMPFMLGGFVLNSMLRFQGSAFYAMLGVTSGAVINIGLDPLFIFVFHMGTGGAALATAISQAVSFTILVYQSGRAGNIRPSLRNYAPSFSRARHMAAGGVPSFFRQGVFTIAMILLNHRAGIYGDAAIAAMSIVFRVIMFALSAIIGFGHGFQPVIGFNYGAGKPERVLQAYRFAVVTSIVALAIMSAAAFPFAADIIAIFRRNDPEVIRIGTAALRYQLIVLPLSGFTFMNNLFFQVLGKTVRATITAVSRQGFFFAPLGLLLPNWFGLTGIQLAQPIGDVMAFFFALALSIGLKRQLRESGNAGKSEEPSPLQEEHQNWSGEI